MTLARALRPLTVIVALGVLTLSGCLPVGAPARAEMVLDVSGDGSSSGEALDAAAVVVQRRLADAGIPVLDATPQGDHVLVRFGEDTTDAVLETAEQIAAFSSRAAFRPVLLAGLPEATEPGGTEPGGTEPGTTEDDLPAAHPTDGSDPAWITPALRSEYDATECAAFVAVPGPDEEPLIACQDDDSAKYLLGPVEIAGATIAGATADDLGGGQWAMTLEFDAEGTAALGAVTTRLVGLESPRNQFAVVLDGEVLIAPVAMAAITDGKPQITGAFDEEDVRVLAGRFRLASLGVQTSVRSVAILD